MNTLLFMVMWLILASPVSAAQGEESEYLRRGTAFIEAQQYQKAVKAFGEAVRINPNSAEAHRGMALAYLKLGSGAAATNLELVDDAVSAFKEALRLAPEVAELRYQLGLACLTLQDKGCAVDEYQALRALDAGLAEQLQRQIAAFKGPGSFRTLVGGATVEGNSTRVTIAGNQVLVPATLTHGGTTVQATLILDTGCSTTFITGALAKKLGMDFQGAKKIRFQVADGRVVQGLQTRLDRLSVGSKSKSGIDVDVAAETGGALPFDGLLGMNFLRSFKYSIDFGNQAINWAQ